ncbi:MAG TPA: Hsp20/alpha crystallin family protein [Chryseosolibacter sp.]
MGYSAYRYCPPGYGPWSYYRRGRYDSPGIPANIRESADHYTLELFAPALTKENFSVSTRNDILYVRYKESGDTFTGRFIRREYNPAEFERAFRLNKKVDVDRIEVAYAGGVLKVTLPKKAESKSSL